jgi:hypothetical protein
MSRKKLRNRAEHRKIAKARKSQASKATSQFPAKQAATAQLNRSPVPVAKKTPLSKSSVESYISLFIAIIFLVVPMTWWLRIVLLATLFAVLFRLVLYSPLTIQWHKPLKALTVAVVFGFICWRAAPAIIADYVGFTVTPPSLSVSTVSPSNDDEITITNTRDSAQYNQVLRIIPSNNNVAFDIQFVGNIETESSALGLVSMMLGDGSQVLHISRIGAHASRVFRVISHLKSPGPNGSIDVKIDSRMFKNVRGIIESR